MKSLKAFFSRVTDCCINPSSYRHLKDADIGTGMWYLYRLLALTWIVGMLWFAAALVHSTPYIRKVAAEIETKLPTLYPKDLVLKFQSGSLSTNVKEPYTVELPAEWAAAMKMGTDDIPTHVVTIDTKATSEDYEKYNTAILLTKNYAVAGKESGEIRMIPYDDIGTMTVTQKKYQDGVKIGVAAFHQFLPTGKALVIVGFILAPFIFALFALLGWMIALLIHSLLLYFFAAIAKLKFSYGQIYKLGLFGATPIVIISMLLWLIGVLQWYAWIFFLLWMGYVMMTIGEKKA